MRLGPLRPMMPTIVAFILTRTPSYSTSRLSLMSPPVLPTCSISDSYCCRIWSRRPPPHTEFVPPPAASDSIPPPGCPTQNLLSSPKVLPLQPEAMEGPNHGNPNPENLNPNPTGGKLLLTFVPHTAFLLWLPPLSALMSLIDGPASSATVGHSIAEATYRATHCTCQRETTMHGVVGGLVCMF